MKFAYCGYDFFSHILEDMLKEHELLELFAPKVDNEYDFNTKVISLAEEAGARTSHNPITSDDLERLKDAGCDLLVSAAYPHKIPKEISLIRYGINIHPTLLPEGKGPWPLPWIILKEKQCSGVTIHKIAEEFDSGDTLVQKNFLLSPEENLDSLSIKTQMEARTMMRELLQDIDGLWSTATPQEGGSFWPMPERKDRTINWGSGVSEIDRMIRAFGSFVSFATVEGVGDIEITDATVWKETHAESPGALVHEQHKELVIAASDGFVCIRRWEHA